MARKSRKNLPQPEQAAASVLLPELEEAKMPAAIYGRLSVEDEETEESMETQIALVQDYINRSRELSYVDTYFDNGFTGTNFKRPAYLNMTSHLEEHLDNFEFDIQLVKSLVQKIEVSADKRIRIVFGFRDVFTELGKESAET